MTLSVKKKLANLWNFKKVKRTLDKNCGFIRCVAFGMSCKFPWSWFPQLQIMGNFPLSTYILKEWPNALNACHSACDIISIQQLAPMIVVIVFMITDVLLAHNTFDRIYYYLNNALFPKKKKVNHRNESSGLNQNRVSFKTLSFRYIIFEIR